MGSPCCISSQEKWSVEGMWGLQSDSKPSVSIEKYPLPKPQHLMTNLAGGLRFSRLDLTQAYFQIVLDQVMQVCDNTHKGLYQYTRVPFEIASAPTLFQHTMDTILQRIPNTICYLDDSLVTGNSAETHLKSLRSYRD